MSGSALPTSEEIESAIRDAGWLLEQDTESALKRRGFNTVAGFAFPDPDDETSSREVDVSGYLPLFQDKDLRMSVGVRVLAECKQSSMPYVLIGRRPDEDEAQRERGEQQFRFDTVEVGQTVMGDNRRLLQQVPIRRYLGIEELPGNPWTYDFLATQMTRMSRRKVWEADNAGIFTGLTFPLAKALSHLRSQDNVGRRNVDHDPARGEWASATFYYPIVVTSGPLFRADASEPGKPTIEPVGWASMIREIRTRKVKGRFTIDVVNYEHLDEFIETRILQFAEAVRGIAESDPARFVTHKDHEWGRQRGIGT